MPRRNRGVRLEANSRGIYEIRWVEEGRSKRRSTGTANAAEAANVLRAWNAGVAREQDEESAGSVRGILDAYFAEHVHRKVVGQGTAEISRRHLLQHFTGHPAEIHPNHVRRYENVRAAGVIGQPAGASTVRRELSVLVAALNHAVKEKRLARVDLPPIPLPEAGEPRQVWMTEEQMEHVFAVAATPPGARLSRAERFLHLAYWTAGRKQAVETLEWNQVDFAGGVVHLGKAGLRKTKKRRASVAMSPRLRAILERAHAERPPGCTYVLDHAGSVRKTFESLALRAGLPQLTAHVLRHTRATLLLRRGVAIWKVAKLLGDTVSTVERVYGHHLPERVDDEEVVL